MILYDTTFPQMSRTLGQARLWLDKAQAHAEKKSFDVQVLLTARLAPDQWHFTRQIQALSVAPLRLSALLRGLTPPAPPDLEPTLEAIRARLDGSRDQLAALRPGDFAQAEERLVPLAFMPGKGMRAGEFVTQFAMPNFYFHAATAYAILRHNGVDIGKMDYIGQLSIVDL